jgi:hypothetical protein
MRVFVEKIAAADANGAALDDSTSASLVDAHIAGRADVKPRTRTNLQQVRRWLVAYFGERKDLKLIEASDAEDWRRYMVSEGLGDNTIRRHIGRARQLCVPLSVEGLSAPQTRSTGCRQRFAQMFRGSSSFRKM